MNPQSVPMENVIRPLARDMAQVATWTMAIISLLALVAYPRAHAFGAEPTFSYWSMIVPQAAFWFLFGMAIYYVSDSMRTYVAMGVSRRRFAAAAGITLAATAVVLSVYGMVGYAVEGWWYSRVGWEHGPVSGGLSADSSSVWLVGLEIMIRALLMAVSGLLVGWSYQRLNAWLASFLLILTAVLPFGIAVVFLGESPELERLGVYVGDLSIVLRVAIALLITFALYLLARELLARTPLKARVP